VALRRDRRLCRVYTDYLPCPAPCVVFVLDGFAASSTAHENSILTLLSLYYTYTYLYTYGLCLKCMHTYIK
jgi:hypothetical protein